MIQIRIKEFDQNTPFKEGTSLHSMLTMLIEHWNQEFYRLQLKTMWQLLIDLNHIYSS